VHVVETVVIVVAAAVVIVLVRRFDAAVISGCPCRCAAAGNACDPTMGDRLNCSSGACDYVLVQLPATTTTGSSGKVDSSQGSGSNDGNDDGGGSGGCTPEAAAAAVEAAGARGAVLVASETASPITPLVEVGATTGEDDDGAMTVE